MKYILISIFCITSCVAEEVQAGIAFIEKYITTYNQDPKAAFLMWADDATVEMKMVDENGVVVKSGVVPISVVINNSTKAIDSGKKDKLSVSNLSQTIIDDTIVVSGNRPSGDSKRPITFTLVKSGETYKISKNVVELGAPNKK